MSNALIQYRDLRQMSQADLAAMIGVTASALCKWERGRIPAERVAEVELKTGISRTKLRPDLFAKVEAVA
jgi:DNA-binding XRE family transcriptional regulator